MILFAIDNPSLVPPVSTTKGGRNAQSFALISLSMQSAQRDRRESSRFVGGLRKVDCSRSEREEPHLLETRLPPAGRPLHAQLGKDLPLGGWQPNGDPSSKSMNRLRSLRRACAFRLCINVSNARCK